jgi:tetratricopeptide (TPR) repeat protein
MALHGHGHGQEDDGRGRPGGRLGGWLLLLPLWSLALACATPTFGPVVSPSSSGRVDRPDYGPEYDVLVGELAARDGEFDVARGAFERAVAKDPDSAHLQYRLARLAAQTDDLPGALRHAERGFELDPEDTEGRLFLGRLYRIDRNLDGVEHALRDEAGVPISPAAALLLYQVYLEGGRFEEALTVAEGLLADDPDNLGGYMAVATVYERLERYDDAEAALRKALDHHPNRFVLYARLARMRRAHGDREGEIEIYREVLAEYPGHYGTLVSMGEAQIAQNDIEGAIATYTRIAVLYPDDLQVVRRLASLEFGAGHYEASADRLRAALAKHPDHYEFAYSLGQVLRGLKRNDEALEVFGTVPKSHALYVESRMQITVILESEERLAEALVEVDELRVLRPDRALDFHAANLRARTGDFEGGAALLERMLDENPDDDEVLYQLGVLYGVAKKTDRALYYMQQVLERNPDNAQALNYIGYTWVERGENLDEAERMIKHAVRLSPDDGYIADSLAWVYYMRARPLMGGERQSEGVALLRQAVEQLDIAVELTGGDPVVSEHLGDVYLLLDEDERALKFYREAIELQPRQDEQPDLHEKLDRLQRELGVPGGAAPGEASDGR